MRILIIHIGAHKTGSTAIQKFFYFYYDFYLKNYQILYPTSKEIICEFGHHYITWYFTPPDFKFDKDNLSQAYKAFLELISSKKYNILISSEDFTWNTRINEFIEVVKPYFDVIYTILYVRPQVEAALSLYQTGVAQLGVTSFFNEWFEKAIPLFDYYSIAKRFSELNCEVIVKPYKKEKFKNEDIIFDFVDTLSEILKGKLTVPEAYKPNSITVNISLPSFITSMILYYNSQPSKDKVVPVLKELGLILRKLKPDIPTLDFVPPSMKRNIVEIYRESNKKLCEEYLGIEYLEWLFPNIEETDEEYLRNKYPGSEIADLCKNVLDFLNQLRRDKDEKQNL
jgi:hypothetical protein